MITVWLPDTEAEGLMGWLPAVCRAGAWTGGPDLPPSEDEVDVVVPPFEIAQRPLSRLADLHRLRLVRLESVGAEWISAGMTHV